MRTKFIHAFTVIRQFTSVCALLCIKEFNTLPICWQNVARFRNVIDTADMARNFSPPRASREKRQKKYVDGEKRTACLPSECDQWIALIAREEYKGKGKGERAGSPFIVLINGAFLREKSWELPRPRPAQVPVPCTPAATMRAGSPRGTGPSIRRMSEPPGSSVLPVPRATDRDLESSRDSR